MTVFTGLQLLLACAALVLIARQLRTLLFLAPLDAEAFFPALQTATEHGRFELARAIAEACAPAWPARLAACALSAPDRNAPAQSQIDDLYFTLRDAAWSHQATIATCGRMASPLALVGVVLQLGSAFDRAGLLALQRGFVMQLAFQRALLTFALGAATSLLCFFAVSILGRAARRVDRDLRRVAAELSPLATQAREM